MYIHVCLGNITQFYPQVQDYLGDFFFIDLESDRHTM